MVDAFNKQGADASESALEQTFADLANARLRDKSPALLDYLVGFQLIKSNDDGSKAVGIFGFEIGDAWHYAPVFFLNGEVKGLDAVYSVKSDLFVPLSEDWVNQIINRRPNQLGEVDTRTKQQAGVRNPNYSRLSEMPGGLGRGFGLGKKASNDDVAALMLAQREIDDLLPLPHLVAGLGAKVASGFIDDIRAHPKLASAIAEFYQLTDFYVPAIKTADHLDDQVKIIAKVDDPDAKDLTEEQKQELLYGGEAIVDKRPEDRKSIVYRMELRQTLQNPTKGGLYDVIMADGTIAELLILSVSGGEGCFLVCEPGSGRHGLIPSQEIFVLREHDGAEFRKVLDRETTKPSSARPGDCTAFVTDSGESTLAFEIDDVNSGEITNLRVRGTYWIPTDPSRTGTTGHSLTTFDYQHDANRRVRAITVSEVGASTLRFLQDRLLVNDKRCRALKLNTIKKQEGSDAFGYGYTKPQEDCNLRTGDMGDHVTIRAALEKVAAPVKVWRADDDVVVKDHYGTQVLAKAAALGYLMRKHGCTADDARLIVKEAKYDPVIWRVKYAATLLPFPELQGAQGGGFMSSMHQTEQPETGSETGQDADPSNRSAYEYNSPFNSGAGAAGGSNTTDKVDRAAQTGQKEVFDASVLSSLIKSHNPTDMIERFLPTIVAGMDRLGRLMFLLHWHYEEFADRYSEDELIEFTDDLGSSFEALGDLVLFMRKRSLSGDPDFYGLGVSATMQG